MTLIEKMEALRNNKEGEDILDKMLIYRHNQAIDKCIAIVKNANCISLPCEVGDTIYRIYDDSDIVGWTVTTVTPTESGNFYTLGHTGTHDYYSILEMEIDNKYWFLTKQQAEAKLEGKE